MRCFQWAVWATAFFWGAAAYSDSDDSAINRYISGETGENVRSEKDIPIEVDQITLVVPSSDGHYFNIRHKAEFNHLGDMEPDDWTLIFPDTARFMASYYDDDLQGGGKYNVPGLPGVFYDTGVYKKSNITFQNASFNRPFGVTVELTDIVFAVTSPNTKVNFRDPIEAQDKKYSLCIYNSRAQKGNCMTAMYASYIQTCSVKPGSNCTLDLSRVPDPLPSPPPLGPADPETPAPAPPPTPAPAPPPTTPAPAPPTAPVPTNKPTLSPAAGLYTPTPPPGPPAYRRRRSVLAAENPEEHVQAKPLARRGGTVSNVSEEDPAWNSSNYSGSIVRSRQRRQGCTFNDHDRSIAETRDYYFGYYFRPTNYITYLYWALTQGYNEAELLKFAPAPAKGQFEDANGKPTFDYNPDFRKYFDEMIGNQYTWQNARQVYVDRGTEDGLCIYTMNWKGKTVNFDVNAQMLNWAPGGKGQAATATATPRKGKDGQLCGDEFPFQIGDHVQVKNTARTNVPSLLTGSYMEGNQCLTVAGGLFIPVRPPCVVNGNCLFEMPTTGTQGKCVYIFDGSDDSSLYEIQYKNPPGANGAVDGQYLMKCETQAPTTLSPTKSPTTLAPTQSPTQSPTVPQDFVCPKDFRFPSDTQYFDRRRHCDKVNEYEEDWGYFNTSMSEVKKKVGNDDKTWAQLACEAIIGCEWKSVTGEGDNPKCMLMSDFDPALLNQTADFFITGLVKVTIPRRYLPGVPPEDCVFTTLWGDKGLNLDYFPNMGNNRFRWPGRFYSTNIKVNPYPRFDPSPPPTPPMTDRFDLFFEYSSESNYTIRGTRGSPDVSLDSYTTPIFPAGEESWVAISASPISVSTIERTVVDVTGRNASNYTLTTTRNVQIVKGTENLDTPEYLEDLRLVIITDLGSEGAYELNKPMGIYQSIQFSDTYQGAQGCAPASKGTQYARATQNQTCSDYRNGTREVALTNESNTQTYCYSAFILNIRTKMQSQRYQFNFTCPPETEEPTMFPTVEPTPDPTLGPTIPPTSLAAGAEASIDADIEKAERSIIEIVVIFVGCLAALLSSIVFINTIFASKKNNLDLRKIPESEKEKVCAPEPEKSYTQVKMAPRPPTIETSATFVPPSPKELKWS